MRGPSRPSPARAPGVRLRVGVGVAVVLALAVSVTGWAGTASAGTASAGSAAAGKRGYIAVYRDTVADVDVKADHDEKAVGFRSRFRYYHAFKGFSAELSEGQLRQLRADATIAFVGEDRAVRAAATPALAAGERVPTGVARIAAADPLTATAGSASSVGVAVIDSGIALANPDLNAVNATTCVAGTSDAADDNGHGTHVAGVIGARNSGKGVVGVAPGTTLYAVKALDLDGYGSFSSLACAIDWVTAHAAALNIRVANLSVGSPGADDHNCGNTNADVLHRAICRATAAGVLFTVAAGNEQSDLAGSVPAAYSEVLAVTAMSDGDGKPGAAAAPTCRPGESDDAYASFSNFAVSSADIQHTIAAPGVCIESTWLGGGYVTLSGTSMAAPHVAGLAALCIGDAGGPGPCSQMSPAVLLAQLRSQAAQIGSTTPGYGFAGDARHPVTGRYYGDLPRSGWVLAPPGAPDAAVSPAVDSVSLSWTASPAGGPASSYAVYRGASSGAETLLASGLPGPIWTDTPPRGTPLYYRVLATNAAGQGPRRPSSRFPPIPSPSSTPPWAAAPLRWARP